MKDEEGESGHDGQCAVPCPATQLKIYNAMATNSLCYIESPDQI